MKKPALRLRMNETLTSRINGHRSAIKKGGQSLLHRHFHQPNHSVVDMRVQILEKIYHIYGSPSLSTPLRRERELFWIKGLGTAKPGLMTKSKKSVP